MIPLCIVSARDAVKTAQTIERLLAALGVDVEICVGRMSASLIEDVSARRQAVLLIWSPGAVGAQYVQQWREHVPASKLIEIEIDARAPDDGVKRHAAIDFTNWNRDRGAHAWQALEARLKTATRVTEPVKPPPRMAAVAMGGAAIMALGGAVAERLYNASHETNAPPEPIVAMLPEAQSVEGTGGALIALEPAGANDPIHTRTLIVRARTVPALVTYNVDPLAEAEAVEAIAFPTQTSILDRFNALTAPLRRDGPRATETASN